MTLPCPDHPKVPDLAELAAKVRAGYQPRPRPVAQREPTPRDLDAVRKRIDEEAAQ